MPIYRDGIRAGVIARMTGIPGVAAGPFESLAEALSELEIPAVVVWIGSEPSVYAGGSVLGRVQRRTATLTIVAIAGDMTTLEDLALEVERRMVAEPYDHEYLYRGTEFGEGREGSVVYLSAQLNYELTYETGELDPTRLIEY